MWKIPLQKKRYTFGTACIHEMGMNPLSARSLSGGGRQEQLRPAIWVAIELIVLGEVIDEQVHFLAGIVEHQVGTQVRSVEVIYAILHSPNPSLAVVIEAHLISHT